MEKTVKWRGSFSWPSEKEKKEEERIGHKIEKEFFGKLKEAKTVEFVTVSGKKYKYELKSVENIGKECKMTLGKAIKRPNKCT